MRKGLLVAFAALLCGVRSLHAEAVAPPCGPITQAMIPDYNGDRGCLYGRVDYLLWRVKGNPLPPLVTTGSLADPFPGALDQPGTRVLFGGDDANYGTVTGARLTVGDTLDKDGSLILEASGLLLERGAASFSAAADAAGSPALFVPVFRSDLGREGRLRIAEPLAGLTGSVTAASRMRLWGVEGNVIIYAYEHEWFRVGLVGGFRYMDLGESLNFNPFLNDTANGTTLDSRDEFRSRNQFYGAQVGTRIAGRYGPATLDLVGKVALGSSRQTGEVIGFTEQGGVGAGNPGTFPGGVLAQPSNIGQRSGSIFTAIPEVQVRIGYQLTPNVKASVGYDALYWNDAVRPGGLIDRQINPTQTLGNPLVGPATPGQRFERSDFWAHGVTLGLELSY